MGSAMVPLSGLSGLSGAFAGTDVLINVRAHPQALTKVVTMKTLFCLMLLAFGPARAQLPLLYQGADLDVGQQLIVQNKCAQCHQRKVGGDGSAIYRPGKRIASAAALRGMVEMCNTELNLALFPDEVNSIAAVLNRDFYRFK